MTLSEISLTNFRNFKETKLSGFTEGINLLIEPNGYGKTNLLEGIAVGFSGISPRTNQPRDMIRWGCQEAFIRTIVDRREYAVNIKKTGRKFYLNGKQVDYKRFLPETKVIFFQPSDLNVFFGSPVLRRMLLNRLIGQLNFQYLHELSEYRLLLMQKNQVLKNSQPDLRLLDIIDDQLAKKAEYIFRERLDLVINLNKLLDRNGILLIYYPSPRKLIPAEALREIMRGKIRETAGNVEGIVREKMRELRNKEMVLGFSLTGPQRDDLLITAKDEFAPDAEKALATFGSRGQQRLAVTNLKLAEFELLEGATGYSPIVLLDDVMSELDKQNRGFLLSQMEGKQVIMTTTEKHSEMIKAAQNMIRVSKNSFVTNDKPRKR